MPTCHKHIETHKGWEIKFVHRYKFFFVVGSTMAFTSIEVAKKAIDLLDKKPNIKPPTSGKIKRAIW